MGNEQFKNILGAVKRGEKFTEINLSFCEVDDIDLEELLSALSKNKMLENITSINLSDNKLTSFNGQGLTNLTKLYLSGNKFTSFNGQGLTKKIDIDRLEFKATPLTNILGDFVKQACVNAKYQAEIDSNQDYLYLKENIKTLMNEHIKKILKAEFNFDNVLDVLKFIRDIELLAHKSEKTDLKNVSDDDKPIISLMQYAKRTSEAGFFKPNGMGISDFTWRLMEQYIKAHLFSRIKLEEKGLKDMFFWLLPKDKNLLNSCNKFNQENVYKIEDGVYWLNFKAEYKALIKNTANVFIKKLVNANIMLKKEGEEITGFAKALSKRKKELDDLVQKNAEKPTNGKKPGNKFK